VRRPFHAAALEEALAAAGIDTVRIGTLAADRRGYLMRPELGRSLSAASAGILAREGPRWGRRDLAVIVSDGLSSIAAERYAAPTLAALLPLLGLAGRSTPCSWPPSPA
jgi:ethanolamine ammonia-lyase small subunit